MAGTSFEANKLRMVLRSHGNRRETSITTLPEEIIFMILILVPAEMLSNVVRYVCREWYALIQDPRFVSTHSLSSTSTALMRRRGFHWDVYQLLDVGEFDVRLTDFKFELPGRVCVMSTCNGLLLMHDVILKTKIYYVGNPITRRILALPRLCSFMKPITCCSLAFEASSKVYKVVVVFHDLRLGSTTIHFKCAILTVGVDKAWRVLDLTHLEKKNKHLSFLINKPRPVTGFIFWHPSSYSFALDIKSEIMNPIPVPCVYPQIGHFLPKGNSISFVVSSPDLSMEVWELKDHKSGEWVKSSYVESELIRNEWENFLWHNNFRTSADPNRLVNPESWLGNGEKILFSMAKCIGFNPSTNFSGSCFSHGHFVVYDLNTRACFVVNTKHDDGHYFVPFIPSLAWV